MSSIFALMVVAVGVFSTSLAHAWSPTSPQIRIALFGGFDTHADAKRSVVDSSGNIYVVGEFEGTVDFDPGPDTANLTSVGVVDLFVLKLNPAGDFVWAERVGGRWWDYASDIALDTSGNVFVAGGFQDTVDFDPRAGTANLTSAGVSDAFVLKLDPSGDYVWARSFGGPSPTPAIGWDLAWGVATDTSGNIFVAGNFDGTVDFDPGLGTANLTSAGVSDGFVLKLDPSGDYVWANRVGGADGEVVSSISIDATGNVFVAGGFQGTVDFDPGPGTANLTSAGVGDAFVLKLDPSGGYLWSIKAGGTGWDGTTDVAVDDSSNVFIAGDFRGTVDFDPGLGTANLTSAGASDVFVLKLDPSGDYVWAKQAPAGGGSTGMGIALDSSGNVFVASSSQGGDFDPGPGSVELTSRGDLDVFVLKLDASGGYVWAKQIGGTNWDVARGITMDSAGNPYVTGLLWGTVDTDPGPGTAEVSSAGSYDGFILKMDSSGSATTSLPSTTATTAPSPTTSLPSVSPETSSSLPPPPPTSTTSPFRQLPDTGSNASGFVRGALLMALLGGLLVLFRRKQSD